MSTETTTTTTTTTTPALSYTNSLTTTTTKETPIPASTSGGGGGSGPRLRLNAIVEEKIHILQPQQLTESNNNNRQGGDDDEEYDNNSRINEINDNRNIDNLARQFKESTHKYIQNTTNQQQHEIQMSLGDGGSNLLVQQRSATIVADPLESLILAKSEPDHKFYEENNATTTSQQQQQQQQINSIQLSFDEQELSNDGLGLTSMVSVGATTTAAAAAAAGKQSWSDQSKHQKIIEKYAEDEELGELATQAMSLYSNINFPYLKNEIKG